MEEAHEMVLDAVNEQMLSYRDTNRIEYAKRNDVVREYLKWSIGAKSGAITDL